MNGITKQYIFHCSEGRKFGHFMGNCQYCSGYCLNIVANSEEEAITKFKKCGGRIGDNGEIIMPDFYCSLMQLDNEPPEE